MRASTVPLVMGMLAVLGFAGLVTYQDPSPGGLAAPHGALPEFAGLPTCAVCHAEEGLTAGCLGCHEEIGAQLESRKGLHPFLIGEKPPDCARCHPEHNGARFPMMEGVAWKRNEFGHEHVEYDLHGKHASLACEECHRLGTFSPRGQPDRKRSTTFLGLSQTCQGCHEDVHEGGLHTNDCTKCHGQEHFRPADRFDHAQFFPLTGGHAQAVCNGCHLLPEGEGLPFDQVRGKACRECHDDPHRTPWEQDCETCHAADEPLWAAGRQSVTAEVHAATGFPLAGPHAEVACDGCHAEGGYGERFPDPPRAEESCRSCHRDSHEGQFGTRACLDCHERTHFDPPRYGRADHATFALVGAHVEAECRTCHTVPESGARRFAGTARECRGCHEDVHGGQFDQPDCAACHGQERFLPPRYDVDAHTSFVLTGAHVAVSCRSCHKRDGQDPRRFVGTQKQCRECHADPHGTQFSKEVKEKDCVACHRSDARAFSIRPFDHAKRTGHRLQGAHLGAACAACHMEVDGVRAYRGTEKQCASCHADAHRGQFGEARCNDCHRSEAAWTIDRFDHRRTRFPLDGTHAKVSCNACHPGVKQPDGSMVVQYKPLGTECGDCHDFKTR